MKTVRKCFTVGQGQEVWRSTPEEHQLYESRSSSQLPSQVLQEFPDSVSQTETQHESTFVDQRSRSNTHKCFHNSHVSCPSDQLVHRAAGRGSFHFITSPAKGQERYFTHYFCVLCFNVCSMFLQDHCIIEKIFFCRFLETRCYL